MGFHKSPRNVVGPSAFPERNPTKVEGSVLGAAFRQENVVASFFNIPPHSAIKADEEYAISVGVPPDPEFDPWEQMEGTEYERYSFLGGARSRPEYDRMVSWVDKQERDKAILSKAGTKAIAPILAAGFLDVPTLVPGLAAARGPYLGYRITSNALRTSAFATGEALATEAMLHGLQEDRDSNIPLTVGGSAVLGLLLGGSMGALIKAQPDARVAAKNASKYLDGEASPEAGLGLDRALYEADGRNLSAAIVDEVRLAEEDFNLPTKSAQRVANSTPGFLSFTETFRRSTSLTARQLGAELLTDAYSFSGKGRLGPSAESAFDVSYGKSAITQRKHFDEAFKTQKRDPESPSLTRSQLSEQVSYALRRGDKHNNPHIKKLAENLRADVINPLKDLAVRARLLDEGVQVSTAQSYLTRMWDGSRIEADASGFKSRLASQFFAEAAQRRNIGEDGFEGLSDLELRGYAELDAQQVYETLTGSRASTGLRVTVKARGPLKERTLNVKDVDFEDFLVNDAEFLLDRYNRTISADAVLAERFGSADMAESLEKVRSDFDKRIEANPNDSKKLAAERGRVLERLEAARDLMRGTYRLDERGTGAARTLRALQSYNFIRLLGDVVASSMGDLVRVGMVHGMRPLFDGAIAPMVKDLKNFRTTAKAAKEAAGISEVLLATRLMRIADITDPYSARTPIENTINTMSHLAGKYSGILHWNDALKSMAVMAFANRMRRLKNSKSDKAFINRLGISQEMSKRIRSQMEEFGESGAVFETNLSKWTDENARSIYLQAMRADADSVIVTPGIGNKVPVAERHFWLKPALQFKSFSLAAHQKVLLLGLQENETRFLIGAVNMTVFGMMAYYYKSMSAGREPSDNIGTWIAEGVDRAGIVPVYMELNNMFEALGGPGAYYQLGSLVGEAPQRASRYQGRNAGGILAGPTAGLVGDAKNILMGSFSGLTDNDDGALSGITDGTISSTKRVMPFGNHPGIKQFLNLWMMPALKGDL